MLEIQSTERLAEPPTWALLERRLIETMNEAVDPIVENYVRADGSLLWPPDDAYEGFNGLDDAYESFYNWPLFYALGGDRRLHDVAYREWEAITEQFAQYDSGNGHPMVVDEYEQGRDWMHQGEGNLLFYYLCLADPTDEALGNRAERFAGFYLPGGEVDNYDPEHRIVRGQENGSTGPVANRPDTFQRQPWMDYVGLPYQDVEGVDTLADLENDEAARQMAEVMQERMVDGDAAPNLAITSLVTNAYLLTGDESYREWVLEYVTAWRERARENGGIIPDNVGLSGEVGEYVDGKWYGGYYGWTFPHGWTTMGDAVVAAAENAVLLSGDFDPLDLPRKQIETLAEEGISHRGTLHVPHRYGDPGWYDYTPRISNVLREDDGSVLWRDGWFEFQPMHAYFPGHLWHASMAERDFELLARLRDRRKAAWERIQEYATRWKDQAGNDGAWIAYLTGDYPDYPAEILAHNYDQVSTRLSFLRTDEQVPESYDDDYLQLRNPVCLEGLVQLTLGAPLPVYNGGLLLSRLRYFDSRAQRPGLPPDVAALVTNLEADSTTVRLVNLGARERAVVVQGGAFGEHRFGRVTYGTEANDLPETRCVDVDDSHFEAVLAPATSLRLELETRRFDATPAYDFPWHDA